MKAFTITSIILAAACERTAFINDFCMFVALSNIASMFKKVGDDRDKYDMAIIHLDSINGMKLIQEALDEITDNVVFDPKDSEEAAFLAIHEHFERSA